MEDDSVVKDSKPSSSPKHVQVKRPYPYHVFFILGNEFCERFAYYGMRAILVIYLLNWVMLSENAATAIYHTFVAICYVSPLFGAVLADGYIGRFKTIMYLSFVYVAGLIIMCLTALPPPFWLGPIIALLAIGVGTGGIKPCVNAFAGDQFSPDQTTEISQFFAIFYFTINFGSLLSMIITPLIRANVYCFHTSCYSLAFSIPAILMVIALVLFFAGRKKYTIINAHENVIGKMASCIGSATSNYFRGPRTGSKQYLDYASPVYENSFIADIRKVLHVAVMFVPLVVYQALFDQQGSRWTLQSMYLNRQFANGWRIPPEMMQICNPLLCLALIPIFEVIIYPLLTACKIPNRPLQRITAGLLFTSLSFVLAGLLQVKIEQSLEGMQHTGADVRLVNTAPCDVEWSPFNISQKSLEFSLLRDVNVGEYSISLRTSDPRCAGLASPAPVSVTLTSGSDSIALADALSDRLLLTVASESTSRPTGGGATVSVIGAGVLRAGGYELSLSRSQKRNRMHVLNVTSLAQYQFSEVEAGSYMMEVLRNDQPYADITEELEVEEGGVYTVVLFLDSSPGSSVQVILMAEIGAYELSVLLQIPQYVLVTIGEVLTSVTALSFAYSQAPIAMKSVVMSLWLLTTAVGNVLDAIITGSGIFTSRAAEMFFFAILMFVTMVVFGIMALFYKYVTPPEPVTAEYDETTSLAPLAAVSTNNGAASNTTSDQTG